MNFMCFLGGFLAMYFMGGVVFYAVLRIGGIVRTKVILSKNGIKSGHVPDWVKQRFAERYGSDLIENGYHPGLAKRILYLAVWPMYCYGVYCGMENALEALKEFLEEGEPV